LYNQINNAMQARFARVTVIGHQLAALSQASAGK
jgi:hypothetical protein